MRYHELSFFRGDYTPCSSTSPPFPLSVSITHYMMMQLPLSVPITHYMTTTPCGGMNLCGTNNINPICLPFSLFFQLYHVRVRIRLTPRWYGDKTTCPSSNMCTTRISLFSFISSYDVSFMAPFVSFIIQSGHAKIFVPLNKLHSFHNVRLSNIAHIHLDVNKSRHLYVFRFINIYMYVVNARKFYIVKRREYKPNVFFLSLGCTYAIFS